MKTFAEMVERLRRWDGVPLYRNAFAAWTLITVLLAVTSR